MTKIMRFLPARFEEAREAVTRVLVEEYLEGEGLRTWTTLQSGIFSLGWFTNPTPSTTTTATNWASALV